MSEPHEPLTPGVYIGLPMARYVRDRALSGSAFARLNSNAPDWHFEHEDNPLWKRPQSDARDLGTLVHVPILEGMAAYESRYCTEPPKDAHPGALDTASDASAWLEARNRALAADPTITSESPGALYYKNGKFKGLAKSGAKEELFARIAEHCDQYRLERPALWADIVERHRAGRELVGDDEDAAVRLAHASVANDDTLSKLVSGGAPELTIVWREDGVPFKCRLDYLKANAIVDLKSFARIGPRGALRSFLADRINHGDDVQAVHQARGVEIAPTLDIVACDSEAAKLVDKVRALLEGPKRFVWLGVRVSGAPLTLAATFDNDGVVWGAARQKIDAAVATYKRYVEEFGLSRMWVRSLGLVEPDISDWPYYATELPND